MGMFDYIKFTCPKCHTRMCDQTKDAECLLLTYDLDEPMSISRAGQIDGIIVECDKCNCQYKIDAGLSIEPILLKLKTPEED